MTDQLPPPLPSAETALGTYLNASVTVLPALLIWLASYFLAHSMQFVFGAVILLLIALEISVRAWPRYRRAAVSVVAVTFHTTVLLGLTAISTSVLIAAPILTRIK